MFGLLLRQPIGVRNQFIGKCGAFINKSLLRNMSKDSEYPPIETAMRKALTTELKPLFLDVINESPMHNTPKQAESHFRVLVVSEKFNDLSLIKRHRLVNDTIKNALKSAGFEFMHALSIEAKTPKQWEPDQEAEKSPPCLGGYGK